MMQQIWVRMGDAGEYESFGDDFDALADHFAECRINTHRIEKCDRGIVANGFEGKDYISLFWGDDEANFVREFIVAEIDRVKRMMRTVATV